MLSNEQIIGQAVDRIVVPDVPVPADQALDTALKAILGTSGA